MLNFFWLSDENQTIAIFTRNGVFVEDKKSQDGFPKFFFCGPVLNNESSEDLRDVETSPSSFNPYLDYFLPFFSVWTFDEYVIQFWIFFPFLTSFSPMHECFVCMAVSLGEYWYVDIHGCIHLFIIFYDYFAYSCLESPNYIATHYAKQIHSHMRWLSPMYFQPPMGCDTIYYPWIQFLISGYIFHPLVTTKSDFCFRSVVLPISWGDFQGQQQIISTQSLTSWPQLGSSYS